ncbi:MAG: hypothetical protein CMJ46_04435, partial [Planctomyces sp.]|nr:hypothetical protein [Planctomyces sp.]
MNAKGLGVSDEVPALIDEYELINCIATGSTTQIWEVSEQGTGRRFAMKLMLPEAYKSSEQRNIIKHEAKVGQAVEHPNIIQFQHFSLKKPNGYILMEYFRALNLKAQIRTDFEGLQSRLKKIVEGVCQGLAAMHDKGWIHLDVKPDNILANKSAEVKLIDFSLARRPGKGLFSGKSKLIRGTRTYLAPETIRKKPPVPATDIYSLGIGMYEIMTGSPPFSGISPDLLLENHLIRVPSAPSKINENITPEADALVLKMLSKRHEDRFGTAHELYAELRKINLFKREPLELKAERERLKREQEAERLASEESKLDSRADALRVQKGLATVTPKGTSVTPKKPVDQVASSGNSGQPAQRRPAPPQPGQQRPAPPQPGQSGQFQMPPGQPAPGQPAPGPYGAGQPYPGQPYPGQGFPNQPFPGQGYPGYPNQPYPGQGYPAAQGQPGQPMPGQPYPGTPPGQQMPPGQQPPQRPQPGQQLPGQPAAGQTPDGQRPDATTIPLGSPLRRPVPPPVPKEPGDDLPEMDELP